MTRIAAIGIDYGISKVHTNIISLEDGTLFAENELPYQWDILEDDRGEIDPDKIWRCAEDSLEALLARADLTGLELRTLSFSSFGDVFVAVDEAGTPVYPMLQFSDRRAESVFEELSTRISGIDYAQLTGGPLDAGYVFPKIYWLKEREPEVYARAAQFFNIQQYTLCRMGLEPVTDYSMAARKMLFDVHSQEWSAPLLDVLDKQASAFGRVVPSATVVGRVSRFGRVALPCELDVVIGAHDAQCGFLGLGVSPDNTSDTFANNAGTYNLLGTLSSRFVKYPTAAITPGSGPCAGSYHYQAGGMIGPTMDWMIGNVCKEPIASLFARARFDGTCKVRMTADPMSGRGAFSGLSVSTTTDDLFCGLIESLTVPMRDLAREMGCVAESGSFKKMRIGAGGAKSPSWIQLKADVLGIPVEKVANLQTSSVGVAILSAVATGVYATYDEAIKSMVRVDRVFEPNAEVSARYQDWHI